MPNQAVFFDRDGTLNFDAGYTHRADCLEFTPQAPEALVLCRDLGYKIIVITNQSGIGRGYYSLAQMHEFHRAMNQKLSAYGVQIDQFYFCPHHPDDQCLCRKPQNLMIETAIRDFDLTRELCYFIGDSPADAGAAQKSNLKFYQYTQGSLKNAVEKLLSL